MVNIPSHFNRALSLLVSQFRDQKPNGDLTNLQKILKIAATERQEINDVLQQLKFERNLESAIGQQLDYIGEIVGLARNPNESDDDYRERLRIRIFVNSANGTPEDQIRLLKALTRANKINYFELRSAFFTLETDGLVFPSPPNILNSAIKEISPAGVNYADIHASYNNAFPFRFGSDVTDQLLFVNPDNQPVSNVLIEPLDYLLAVNNGYSENNVVGGGFAELNYPSPTAGALSELISINGNLAPRRFQ